MKITDFTEIEATLGEFMTAQEIKQEHFKELVQSVAQNITAD
jgi:predicted sulfurtransferase